MTFQMTGNTPKERLTSLSAYEQKTRYTHSAHQFVRCGTCMKRHYRGGACTFPHIDQVRAFTVTDPKYGGTHDALEFREVESVKILTGELPWQREHPEFVNVHVHSLVVALPNIGDDARWPPLKAALLAYCDAMPPEGKEFVAPNGAVIRDTWVGMFDHPTNYKGS